MKAIFVTLTVVVQLLLFGYGGGKALQMFLGLCFGIQLSLLWCGVLFLAVALPTFFLVVYVTGNYGQDHLMSSLRRKSALPAGKPAFKSTVYPKKR